MATPSSWTTASGLHALQPPELDRCEGRRHGEAASGALGRTGQTGLAAGDHLHYGVYLHVAVLPVEWWDPKWIKDNIEPKLEGMSGEAIAEMQQPRKARGNGGARPVMK